MRKKAAQPRRNEIYMANLPVTAASVQYGRRPVLVLQNNTGNMYSSTTIIAPMTGRSKKTLPTHVRIGPKCGLSKSSILLCEQVMTIPTEILETKLGEITDEMTLKRIAEALRCSLDL